MENIDSIALYLPLLVPLFIIGVIIITVIVIVKTYLHKRKMKKLKYEWTWVMKKAKVAAIWERYVSGDEDSSWYYLYRLEADDEEWNVYKSDSFRNAEHWWRTLEQMIIRYDGVVYDLWNKDEAIRQINDNKHRLEMELQNNPWFFKKMWLKMDIKKMEEYIEIANEWPITPYLVCNGYKVSVWDSVDIFVNPENIKEYYFDLDFTKQK